MEERKGDVGMVSEGGQTKTWGGMRQVNDLCLFKPAYLIYLLNIYLEEKLISLGKNWQGGHWLPLSFSSASHPS